VATQIRITLRQRLLETSTSAALGEILAGCYALGMSDAHWTVVDWDDGGFAVVM